MNDFLRMQAKVGVPSLVARLPRRARRRAVVVRTPARRVALASSAVALFATLTTLAHGRFSDNAFLLLPVGKTVQFVPFGELDLDTLKSTLRVEHVATYR